MFMLDASGGRGDSFAEVEDIEERDVAEAMCWALEELATMSRDRATQATGQCYQLMSELVKIREDSARQDRDSL